MGEGGVRTGQEGAQREKKSLYFCHIKVKSALTFHCLRPKSAVSFYFSHSRPVDICTE